MEPLECVRVEVDGVLGLVPHSWPPGPVRVAAVLPSSVLASKIGVGDELLKVNDTNVCDLDRSALARELSRRPLSLEIKRFSSLNRECSSETIDVQVGVSDGAVGFCPRDWHSKPMVVGAVLPNQAAAAKGVREGDVLVLVDGQQASAMTAAELATALSRRPISIRFQRSFDENETARGDPFLASLDDPPPARTGAFAAAADADARNGRDGRELLLPSETSEVASATAKQIVEDTSAASAEAGLLSASPRRPPKPRRPVKVRSQPEQPQGQEQRQLADASTRRPPQPVKPATKPAKSQAPREALEGGTQTEAPLTAEKGVQRDIEPQDLQELPQPLSAANAHVVPLEQEEEKEEEEEEAQASGQGVDETAAAAGPASNNPEVADLPALLRPPSILEPQPDMPPLRPRDLSLSLRRQSPEPFKFRELPPPPRAPPALWAEPRDLGEIAVANSRSQRPSILKELPPPDRPPLPVEVAWAREEELQLWRHVPEDLKPDSPETAEDLEEWLRLSYQYLPGSTTIF
ncbi:unnamed protein product [Symbiodinium sp. CCMP2592]|nr:unnamed protein product [Symbiodinium sp. CCMP2592]